MRFLIFTLLALLSSTFGVPEVTKSMWTPNGNKVDVVGQSGKLKLTTNGTDNWLMISPSQFREYNSNGQKVATANIASSSFVLGDPSDTTVTDANGQQQSATQVQLAGSFNQGGVSVEYKYTVFVYKTDVTLLFGNNTVTVPQNNVKFEFEIKNWPFASSTNKLHWAVTCNSQGGKNSAQPQMNQQTNSTYAIFGPGSIDSPNYAVVDGAKVSIDVTTTVNGGNYEIGWAFPAGSSIQYDPVLAVSSNSASTLVVSSGLMLLSSLMVFLGSRIF